MFLLPAIFVFIFISVGRFGSQQSEVINTIFDYYGQGFINFSKIFDLFPNGSFFGKMTFPVFFPLNEAVSIANLNDKITNTNFNLNTFSTIIGSIYEDFGYFGTLIVVLLIYFLFRFIAILKHNSILYPILTLYMYQVLVSGVFYFMNYTQPFQKFIGIIIAILIYRKYFFVTQRFNKIPYNNIENNNLSLNNV